MATDEKQTRLAGIVFVIANFVVRTKMNQAPERRQKFTQLVFFFGSTGFVGLIIVALSGLVFGLT